MADLPDGLQLYLDPGEDAGWCVGRGHLLLGAFTTKMWELSDDVWNALCRQRGIEPWQQNYTPLTDLDHPWLLDGMAEHLTDEKGKLRKIDTIVSEDWRLYPNKLRALAWDQCRTARVIGSFTAMTRAFHDVSWHLQPAAIKPEAVAAGAEELYYRPLRENRHQNDAIQHFVYFQANGPEGSGFTPNNVSNKERDSS